MNLLRATMQAILVCALVSAASGPAALYAGEPQGEETWCTVRFSSGRLLIDLPQGFELTRKGMTDFTVYSIAPKGEEKPKVTLGIYVGFAPNFHPERKVREEGVKSENGRIGAQDVTWFCWTESEILHVETLVVDFYQPAEPAEPVKGPKPASPWIHFFIRGTDPDTVVLLRKAAETFRQAPRGKPDKGRILWEARLGARPGSAPAAADGRVFIGTADGKLHALDAGTGTSRWVHEAPGAVATAPAVSGGRVFFSSADGTLTCLDAASGRLAWTYHGGEALGKGSPAVEAGRVFTAAKGGRCVALDATTGETLWKSWRVRGSPVVSRGTVFFGSSEGRIMGIEARSGKLKWKGGRRGAFNVPPAVHGSRIFYDGDDGRLRCMLVGSSEVAWVSEVKTAGAMAVWGSERIGHLLVSGGDGAWLSIDTGTGKPWNEFETGSPVSAPALAATGKGPRFFVCGWGKLFCLTGHPLSKVWEIETGAPSLGSPVVSGGRLFVGTGDGRLLCLQAGDADGWPMLGGGPGRCGTNALLDK